MKLQTPYPSAANLALTQSILNHKGSDHADWTIEIVSLQFPLHTTFGKFERDRKKKTKPLVLTT